MQTPHSDQTKLMIINNERKPPTGTFVWGTITSEEVS